MGNSLFDDGRSCRLIHADAIAGMRTIPDDTVDCIVTSPPYWGLRAYTHGESDDEIGVEPLLPDYIRNMRVVFHECMRILKPSGILWLNIGDGYTSGGRKTQIPDSASMNNNNARGKNIRRPDTPAGLKKKDMLGVPWRVAFALQDDGWYLRADVIWRKPNYMPVGHLYDRPQMDYEHVFMLTKNEYYDYNIEAGYELKSDGTGTRQGRSIWDIPTDSRKTGHPAVMPLALADKCVRLSLKPRNGTDDASIDNTDDNENNGFIVFDPFTGSGTTAVAALTNDADFIGTELSDDFIQIASRRILYDIGVNSEIMEA